MNMHSLDSLVKSHTSQFDLDLPRPVEKCCCGIASAIFALRYFKVDLEASSTELALNFIDSGQYTQPIVSVRFTSYPSRTFPVLPSKSKDKSGLEESLAQAKIFMDVYSGDIEPAGYSLEIIYTGHQVYAPAFLMRSGTDIRGLSHWLEKKGLQTEICEYREQIPLINLNINHKIFTQKEEFIKTFKNALSRDNTLLISSVTQSKFNYTKDIDIVRDIRFTGTHVVVATKGKLENQVVYADPAYTNGDLGIKQIELEKFLEALINSDKKGAHFLIAGEKATYSIK